MDLLKKVYILLGKPVIIYHKYGGYNKERILKRDKEGQYFAAHLDGQISSGSDHYNSIDNLFRCCAYSWDKE